MSLTDVTATDRDSVLAVYLGENVGYCYEDKQPRIKPQVWRLPAAYLQDHGYVGAALHNQLGDFNKVNGRPRKIFLSYYSDETTPPDFGMLLAGLIICVKVFANRRAIPLEAISQTAVQQAVFQRSDMSKRALKTAVTSLCKRRGFPNIDIDAAYALVLYEYATSKEHARVGDVKAA